MSLPGHFCFQDQLSSQHFCHLYWQPYRFTNHAYHTLSIIKICWKGIFYKFLGFKLFCWWKCVLYSKIIDLVARLFPLLFLFFLGLLLVLYIVEEALEACFLTKKIFSAIHPIVAFAFEWSFATLPKVQLFMPYSTLPFVIFFRKKASFWPF